MTDIPTEAVKAVANVFVNAIARSRGASCDVDLANEAKYIQRLYLETAHAALTAALPHLSPPVHNAAIEEAAKVADRISEQAQAVDFWAASDYCAKAAAAIRSLSRPTKDKS